MNAEFQWWLLILGIVIGGALVYLVLADMRTDQEEADWLGDDEPVDEWAMPPTDPVEASAPTGPGTTGDGAVATPSGDGAADPASGGPDDPPIQSVARPGPAAERPGSGVVDASGH